MCQGGRLLADFVAGTKRRPAVPESASVPLTQTVDGRWVVWAHKIARRLGDRFQPLTGNPAYPTDAVAVCARRGTHRAPQRRCTCGFHALSAPWPGLPVHDGLARLEVALSGRVLVFDWAAGGLLFRAERQTVVRVHDAPPLWMPPPEDPEGRLVRRSVDRPRGGGSVRLHLPGGTPEAVALSDDAGYCLVTTAGPRRELVLV